MDYLVKIKVDKKFPEDNRYLVLDNSQEWQLKSGDIHRSIGDEKFIIGLLPLLEYSYSEFVQEMEYDTIYLKKFPLFQLLKFPFDNKMIYWSDLSLLWFMEIDISDQVGKWAQSIDVKWMKQKMRHEFWKIMNIRSWPKLG